jgi:ABC-type molybdenum transport system ATPase subunit/photorepair protein PhrA
MLGLNRRLQQCLLKISDGVFKQDFKSPSIFTQPINFSVYKPELNSNASLWSIVGNKKSVFLNIIAGKHLAVPPTGRTYPSVVESHDFNSVQFLNFTDNSGLDKVHLSARYETYSHKGKLEMSDDTNSVLNYIVGTNNYNNLHVQLDKEYIQELLSLFNLNHLQLKWINSLSNGQMRRSRIAKALINKPSLLVIDDPFLGLDPKATELVSNSLHQISKELNLGIVIGLRSQDKIPDWIERTVVVDDSGITEVDRKLVESSQANVETPGHQEPTLVEISNKSISGPIHLEFTNASVAYKGLKIFENFFWKIPQGSKWRILGDNGTGKTTLLSIITGDHPQSWRGVISIDGKLRKTGSGITFFDISNDIGISSPELHALVPMHTKTMKEVIFNGLVPDIGNSNFMYKPKDQVPNEWAKKILNKFSDRLQQNDDKLFSELTISEQKLSLFLRAIIKQPRLLILDEAFSCMDDVSVMKQCHDVVANDLADMTVLVIGHIDWELPRYDYVLKLVGDDDRNYQILKVE